MNTKDNQRSRLTRMLLKNSYMHLMRTKTANRITIKDICEGAEVNRSTFYIYYKEPNDLLMELEDECIARVVESLNSIGASEEASSDAQAYLLAFLRDFRRNDELLRTLLVDNNDPHFRRKLMNVALSLTETAFDIDLKPDYKHLAYRYIVSGSIELLVDWIRNDYTVPEQVMCKMLYQLCEGSLMNL